MSDLQEYYTINITVLHKGNSQPLNADYTVRLLDKDPLADELLGEAHPDPTGQVAIQVNPEQFKSWDSPGEKFGDLYFTVTNQEEKEIYRSPVIENFAPDELADFSFTEGEHYNMGTFLIEA